MVILGALGDSATGTFSSRPFSFPPPLLFFVWGGAPAGSLAGPRFFPEESPLSSLPRPPDFPLSAYMVSQYRCAVFTTSIRVLGKGVAYRETLALSSGRSLAKNV